VVSGSEPFERTADAGVAERGQAPLEPRPRGCNQLCDFAYPDRIVSFGFEPDVQQDVGGALDVHGQQFGGFVLVVGEGCVEDGAVFSGDVPFVDFFGDRQPSIELMASVPQGIH
jgi:hypothetical protein